MDGTVFEFDTGSVIVFREEDGFDIGEGNTVTITDNNENTRIFEFDSDGVLNVVDAIAVPFNTLMFPAQLMERLVDEINFFSGSSNFTVLADISDNTNRITLFNESLDAASGVVSNSAGIQIEGAPGISHDVRIPVEETDENLIDQLATIEDDFASAIVQAFATAEGNEIVASRDGNRINFSGATTADFSEIVARDVFTVVTSSDGFTSPGVIGIDFLAQDTPQDLALKIVTAINGNTTATASLVGVNGVRLLGNAEFGDIQEPLRLGGQAPGGVITGMTFLNNRLYAVTGDDPFTFGLVEGGGLFEIVGFAGNNATLDYVETSVVLTAVDQNGDPTDEPIDFAGLVSGPANAADGRFAETLFGIDTNGSLYAFSEAGIPVPAFVDGKSAIHTNLPSVDIQGLAFAKLDVNLWHVTDQRGTDPGHRLQRTFDGLRDLEGETSSFYFGYEDQATLGTDLSAPLTQNNYNFIGGAHGVLESSPFSLKGYSPGDRPALYFDYYLDTEQANASQRFDDTFMRDSFRVYIGGEDGIWRLLSTNNSHTAGGDFNDELDPFGSLVSTPGLGFEEVFAQPLQTQQAFDVNEEFEGATSPDSWRQIRVPLDEYAGRDQLRLRFEFSTAGGLGPALLTSAARDNTVGVELFAVAGNSVVDGGTLDEEVFQISTSSNRFFSGFGLDETVSFEFEMGPTLVAMSGGAIDDGASIWVDGKYYEFDKDGLLNNAGLNTFTIPIDDQMTPEQVAREIDLAIVSNHSIPLTADLFQESNDTVSAAIATGLFGFTSTFSAAGTLGDNQNLNTAGLDVDFLAVELKSGDTIQVDIDAQELNGGLNDSYLRLFDNRFVEKANNDNRSGPGENPSLDSFLSFTVEDPGTYYVGVSSAGNTAYNPTFEGSGESGNTGDYHIDIAIIQPRAATPVDILFQEPNDTIATAANIGLTGMASKFVAVGVIGDNLSLDDRFVFLGAEEDEDLDVDLISVQLSAGDTIAVDIDTLGLSGSLSDSFLRIFDANGNEL
ncbi:MAG TPA: hypothetical protein EYN18_03500, partial [Nitrospirales bacterium]|nr:hypothetical protein [Nitrospirales bacterium]